MSDRFSPAYEVKFAAPTAAGEFSGYASMFGGPADSYGDVIAPGAFVDSLSKHADAGSSVALLWAHDPGEPIGKWLSIAEDARGLAVTGKLSLGVQRANDARALMLDGALGLSIGFLTLESKYDRGARVLPKIALYEASLVASPANTRAQVTSVKSALSPPGDIRQFEALLHDTLGFSVRESKRLASGGWRAFEGRGDDSEELHQVAAMFRSAARQFTPL